MVSKRYTAVSTGLDTSLTATHIVGTSTVSYEKILASNPDAAKEKPITELNGKIAAQDVDIAAKKTEIDGQKTDKAGKETELQGEL